MGARPADEVDGGLHLRIAAAEIEVDLVGVHGHGDVDQREILATHPLDIVGKLVATVGNTSNRGPRS